MCWHLALQFVCGIFRSDDRQFLSHWEVLSSQMVWSWVVRCFVCFIIWKIATQQSKRTEFYNSNGIFIDWGQKLTNRWKLNQNKQMQTERSVHRSQWSNFLFHSFSVEWTKKNVCHKTNHCNLHYALFNKQYLSIRLRTGCHFEMYSNEKV